MGSNQWGPRNGEELFSDLYQRLRILDRNRSHGIVGPMPDAIDASGGEDVIDTIDFYVEGQEQYVIPPEPVPGTPPPVTEDASPMPTALGPTLNFTYGVTRASITDHTHTTGGGASLVVAAEWSFEDLYSTPGVDVGVDPVDATRIVIGTTGWYELTLYMTIVWGSAQSASGLLDWISRAGTFYPRSPAAAATNTFSASVNSPRIWIPSGGWIKPQFSWTSTTAPTSVAAAVDVTWIA